MKRFFYFPILVSAVDLFFHLYKNKTAPGLFSFILAITGDFKAEEYGTPVMEEYVMENDETPLNDQFDIGIIAKVLKTHDSVAKIYKQDSISVKNIGINNFRPNSFY